MGFEATFTDISNWQKNIHYSTGGSRSKYIALNPETNVEYFFKGSKETKEGEIRYPTEFWSEIVASKIGQSLGFPMLDYNIAYNKNHKQKIGCISKSMVLSSQNKLTEGKSYLTGFNSKYNPDKDKSDYTYQFICEALDEFQLHNYIRNILEIIVFDTIIGNSDRHQENWGIITNYQEIFDNLKKEIESKDSNNWKKFVSKLNRLIAIGLFIKNTLRLKTNLIPNVFAPIYDSGCCLGREHPDEKIRKMLNDSQMLNSYISKGESEIHWKGIPKKRTHFELIELLINQERDLLKLYIKRVKENYNPEDIRKTINNIDLNLPVALSNFKLSDDRKKLMFKLITLRIEKLLTFI
jgi:hypothetical protein